MRIDYDKKDPKSIEEYAKNLIGKTFEDVLKNGNTLQVRKDNFEYYGNVSRKGGLGNLLEEQYFGYKANSISEADFSEAGGGRIKGITL